MTARSQTSYRKRRAATRGFSLIELMVVLLISTILSVIGYYGVRKYIHHARTAEGRSAVGRMARDAASAYNRVNMEGKVLDVDQTAAFDHRLCVGASARVPDTIDKVAAKKYQSTPQEWRVDGAVPGKGFNCLRFSMEMPQYYQYAYLTSTNSSSDAWKVGTQFEAIARADLNGNGVRSTLTMRGEIRNGPNGAPELFVAPNLEEINPDE